MSIGQWIFLLPKILKVAVGLIIALEDVIPEDGFGSDKLAALDEILQDIIEAADDIDIDYEIVKPRVHKIVNVLVRLLNKVGKFK